MLKNIISIQMIASLLLLIVLSCMNQIAAAQYNKVDRETMITHQKTMIVAKGQVYVAPSKNKAARCS